MIKEECFAYDKKKEECKALKELYCKNEECKFYKTKKDIIKKEGISND